MGGSLNVTVIEPLLVDAALATLNGARPVKVAVLLVSTVPSLARVTLLTVTVNELADCVKRSLERYFKDMDGEKPTSIYEMVLKNIEKPMIETVLGKAEGNQSLAAEMLGVTRNTLRKKMQQLRIKG